MFCEYEQDYTHHPRVSQLLAQKNPWSDLLAARLVRSQEGTPFLKLPVSLAGGQEPEAALNSVQLAEEEKILLKVSGVMTGLLESKGLKTISKNMLRRPDQVHD